jgi:hypothetical protein
MIIKATLFTLIIILVVVITTSYYVNKEGFDNITTSASSSPQKVAITLKQNSVFLNVFGNTTDGTTINNAKFLYNSTIPVLSAGQKTDSSFGSDITITPVQSLLMTYPLNTVKTGVKYYIVSSEVSEYVEGVTPLLGSFQYSGSNAEIMPNAAVPSTSTNNANGIIPKREDIIPSVSISGSGYDAMNLQQKTDLLRDIQKAVRNELIAGRNTTPIIPGETRKEILPGETRKDHDSNSTAQGKEYENNCYKDNEYRCPKNPDGSCPPLPDMTQYIRKDQIPCWGCSLDY